MLKSSFRTVMAVTAFLCVAASAGTTAAAAVENGIKSSLVRIFSVQAAADYDLPWNMLAPAEYSGSGCIIDGRRILTNAHVVSESTYLEVKPYGSAQTYAAAIAAVSHEADLALLTVEDEGFWEGRNALPIGRLPEVLEEVNVYGFPSGGDSLSLSKGIVSRIEVNNYAHSVFTPLTENLLATWGDDWDEDAPSHLLALNDEFKTEECEQAIILSKVLAHDLNRGFESYEQSRITHLNGKRLLNMRDLVRRIETEKKSLLLPSFDPRMTVPGIGDNRG